MTTLLDIGARLAGTRRGAGAGHRALVLRSRSRRGRSPTTYRASISTAVPPARDLGEIAARIRARGADFSARGLPRIGVFGSFARGEQTPDSDVDLLAEFSDKPSGFEYMEPPAFAEPVRDERSTGLSRRYSKSDCATGCCRGGLCLASADRSPYILRNFISS